MPVPTPPTGRTRLCELGRKRWNCGPRAPIYWPALPQGFVLRSGEPVLEVPAAGVLGRQHGPVAFDDGGGLGLAQVALEIRGLG